MMNYFNYFTEIEEEFVKRRGSHMMVSPLDWTLIETWKQRGIPLHIVLRGINSSFDGYDQRLSRGRKVNSLFFCQQEVEALYQEGRLHVHHRDAVELVEGLGADLLDLDVESPRSGSLAEPGEQSDAYDHANQGIHRLPCRL